MYEEHLAKLAWVLQFVGFNLLYFSMFILGWMGMPRRYYDYLPQFNTPNLISTIGSWVLAMGLFLMFYNLIRSIRAGEKAGDNPWDAATLEWRTSSPRPRRISRRSPR